MLQGGTDPLRLDAAYQPDAHHTGDDRILRHVFEVPAAQRGPLDVDAGAEDVDFDEDTIEVYTGVNELREVREALQKISQASMNLRANPHGGTLSLAILPVMILYLIFSRQLIRGITSGAVK